MSPLYVALTLVALALVGWGIITGQTNVAIRVLAIVFGVVIFLARLALDDDPREDPK
jgi:hypothetical protein